VRPRTTARSNRAPRRPALLGPERPYGTLVTVTRWSDIPDGQVGLLDASVVFGPSGPPHLCKVPDPALHARFEGCPPESPVVTGSFAVGGVAYSGPVVVRRRGEVADLAVVHGFYRGYR
jgi:hypothetical protein